MYWDKHFSKLWRKCVLPSIRHPGYDAPRHLVRQLKNHPWRTFNPSEAIIFVIPLMTYGPPANYECKGFGDIFADITESITSTQQFIRSNGTDHIIIDTNFRTPGWWKRHPKSNDAFRHVIHGVYHLQNFASIDRCHVRVPKTTSYGPFNDPPSDEAWNGRQTDYFFVGQSDTRPAYTSRHLFLEAANLSLKRRGGIHSGPYAAPRNDSISEAYETHLSLIAVSSSAKDAVGDLPECTDTDSNYGCRSDPSTEFYYNELSNSRYNLMFRGDDYSSKRIYDSLQTGAINLMISDGVVPEVLAFQCIVPWLDMIYQIPEAVFNNDPIGTLNKFDAKFGKSGFERASVSKTFDRINRHVADVIWDLEDSRVAINALFTAARKCLGYFSDWKCPYEDRSGWEGFRLNPIKGGRQRGKIRNPCFDTYNDLKRQCNGNHPPGPAAVHCHDRGRGRTRWGTPLDNKKKSRRFKCTHVPSLRRKNNFRDEDRRTKRGALFMSAGG
eukprot:Selendium_serpulae@DN6472_c0_g1_i1.p1